MGPFVSAWVVVVVDPAGWTLSLEHSFWTVCLVHTDGEDAGFLTTFSPSLRLICLPFLSHNEAPGSLSGGKMLTTVLKAMAEEAVVDVIEGGCLMLSLLSESKSNSSESSSQDPRMV
jgi:hypothetical protein